MSSVWRIFGPGVQFPSISIMHQEELMWLAGLLEGEGSFMKPVPSEPRTPRITLDMTDLDVVQRAAKLMGVSYICVSDRKPGIWKKSYRITIKGSPARELMLRLFPHMGVRRQQRIQEILSTTTSRKPGENKKKLSDTQVAEIFQTTESSEVVGKRYGVSGWLIRQIRSGKHRFRT